LVCRGITDGIFKKRVNFLYFEHPKTPDRSPGTNLDFLEMVKKGISEEDKKGVSEEGKKRDLRGGQKRDLRGGQKRDLRGGLE